MKNFLKQYGLEIVSYIAGVVIGAVVISSDVIEQAGFTTLGKVVLFTLWMLAIIEIIGGANNAK